MFPMASAPEWIRTTIERDLKPSPHQLGYEGM